MTQRPSYSCLQYPGDDWSIRGLSFRLIPASHEQILVGCSFTASISTKVTLTPANLSTD
ncbi:hypothetical protein K439DRAFT_1628799 [Ramaria rubella]|nr:hypothetical protein K439DRAFT_1628799 [Ramaria rubella]